MAEAARIGAFDGLKPFGKTGKFTLEPVEFRARFNFRGSAAAARDLGSAFGADLSLTPMRAGTGEAGRAALWLGPDEWMLIAPVSEHQALIDLVARVVIEPHSLVDVSHRNAALTVSGSKVEAVLNAGNPLDLDVSAFPVGMCTRTLLGKCEIILWRTGPFTFHIEAFRSFMPYVHAYLTEAAREYTGG